MIYKNVEFHNIAEIKERDDGSVSLQRVPDDVRLKLNPSGQIKMCRPACAEIRFVFYEDSECSITLSANPDKDISRCKTVVFFGEYQLDKEFILTEEKQTIKLSMPERLRLTDNECLKNRPFSYRVCRLISRGAQICFHGAEAKGLRPPKPEELPDIRLLTYGTSITHGASASSPHLAYAVQTARHIGADLLNLGSGGSAHCENELADYIASREDWDIASLALSVNMRGFELDEFYSRVSYMVNAVSGADTKRPVACITLWPYFDDMTEGGVLRQFEGKKSEEYRQKLRDAVKACPHPNIHLLEGPEMLTDTAGLIGDLLHPGDYGMMEMGRNLGENLMNLLQIS